MSTSTYVLISVEEEETLFYRYDRSGESSKPASLALACRLQHPGVVTSSFCAIPSSSHSSSAPLFACLCHVPGGPGSPGLLASPVLSPKKDFSNFALPADYDPSAPLGTLRICRSPFARNQVDASSSSSLVVSLDDITIQSITITAGQFGGVPSGLQCLASSSGSGPVLVVAIGSILRIFAASSIDDDNNTNPFSQLCPDVACFGGSTNVIRQIVLNPSSFSTKDPSLLLLKENEEFEGTLESMMGDRMDGPDSPKLTKATHTAVTEVSLSRLMNLVASPPTEVGSHDAAADETLFSHQFEKGPKTLLQHLERSSEGGSVTTNHSIDRRVQRIMPLGQDASPAAQQRLLVLSYMDRAVITFATIAKDSASNASNVTVSHKAYLALPSEQQSGDLENDADARRLNDYKRMSHCIDVTRSGAVDADEILEFDLEGVCQFVLPPARGASGKLCGTRISGFTATPGGTKAVHRLDL